MTRDAVRSSTFARPIPPASVRKLTPPGSLTRGSMPSANSSRAVIDSSPGGVMA
jgi:hypothetical protein